MELQDIIRYYRDCYSIDFKGVNVYNFFGSGSEHVLIPDSTELLSGKFEEYPVSTAWGQKIEETLLLDSKEKSLYTGSFFVKGSTKVMGKSKRVFAPLYLHDLQLRREEEVYYIKTESSFINPAFINVVRSNDNDSEVNLEELLERLPDSPIGFENLHLLKKNLEYTLKQFELQSIEGMMRSHGSNLPLEEIHKSRSAKNFNCIHAGLAMGIFKKPIGSRGVINELNTLAQTDLRDNLISELFFPVENTVFKKSQRVIHVPASLSEAQENIFQSSDNYKFTMVVGPPGTGKSFSIAALAVEAISSGESVLVASRNSQAGKVVSSIIENDFGLKNVLIKAYNKNYKRSLIARLSKIKNGFFFIDKALDFIDLRMKIEALHKQLKTLINKAESVEKSELKWGRFYYENQSGFFTTMISAWNEFVKSRTEPIWKIAHQLKLKENQKINLLRKYVNVKIAYNLDVLLKRRRKDFGTLVEAIKAKTGNEVSEKFERIDFPLVLEALPLWV